MQTRYYINGFRVTSREFDTKYCDRVSERWTKTRNGTLIARIYK
jgi:hypothetical protein